MGQWEPGFAPTDFVAHWCVVGHRVGIMAAHGVSQMEVFSTFHPIPSPIPPTPSISKKIGYNENQYITKYFTV